MDLIDWTCDTCHKPANGRGAISITYADIHRADAVRKEPDFTSLSPRDVLTLPNLGRWKVQCNTCAGYCEGAYAIDLEQARTVTALERWTEHLSDKTWFNGSNWMAVVIPVIEAQRTRSSA